VPTSFCRIFIEKETLLMKRTMVSGLGVALLLGVVGCGPAGLQEGAPTEGGKGVTPDPNMVNPIGKMGTKTAKEADTKNNAAGKNAPAPAPDAP